MTFYFNILIIVSSKFNLSLLYKYEIESKLLNPVFKKQLIFSHFAVVGSFFSLSEFPIMDLLLWHWPEIQLTSIALPELSWLKSNLLTKNVHIFQLLSLSEEANFDTCLTHKMQVFSIYYLPHIHLYIHVHTLIFFLSLFP